MIALFGKDATIFPGSEVISTLAPGSLWGTYIKYIGAGAVAAGGIMSLIKTSPLIVRTFKQAMGSMAKNRATADASRTLMGDPLLLLLTCF